MDSRWPKLVFLLLLLYATVHFGFVYPQLPGVVASHFDGRGVPNGWQPKQAFFGVVVVVSMVAAMIGFAMPKMIAVLPPPLIHLPNKNYWLAPERRAETMAFLEANFAWFACALFLFNILAFDYAVQINLRPGNPPGPARFWYILAAFLIFTVVWTIQIVTKFLRPPEENQTRK